MKLLYILLACLFAIQASAQITVPTQSGPVTGLVLSDHVSFRGIPFAAPPVGDLRWAPPSPVHSWTTARDATKFGFACPQRCDNPAPSCPDDSDISEDCLTLNIFTPLNFTILSKPLPVMFFIHGGRFWSGFSGSVLYDGRYLVNTADVIVVTINYRLGALGFLATPNFGSSFGFLDQRFALQWVQKNIIHFGGDPNSVTIFGQSAGAMSVAAHMVSTGSKGLFHRAILHSDPFGLPFKNIETGHAQGLAFATNISCITNGAIDYDCLRKVDVQSILATEHAVGGQIDWNHKFSFLVPYTPLVDGVDILCQPLECFETNQVVSKVPMIAGTTTEEARVFIYGALSSALPWYEFDAALYGFFGITNGSKINDIYPSNYSADCRDQFSNLGTDLLFDCATRHAAALHTLSGQSTWLYLFDHVSSFDFWAPEFSYCTGHNCHGEDLPFIFGSASLYDNHTYTADEASMVQQWQTIWGRFARNGDPNNSAGDRQPINVPSWPSFDISSPQRMQVATPSFSIVQKYQAHFCDFWDNVVGYDGTLN